MSCTVGSKCEVGEGCVIGEGAVLADGVVLAPGTVVPNGAFLATGTKWEGNPAVKVGEGADADAIRIHAERIAYIAEDHIREYLPYGNAYKHLEAVVEDAGIEAAK